MRQVKIFFTERQLRFIEAIKTTGRAGVDRSDVVRRALDARIDDLLKAQAIRESDGGESEKVAPEPVKDE